MLLYVLAIEVENERVNERVKELIAIKKLTPLKILTQCH